MRPTVFVVGAGASTEFGLVAGLELKSAVRELLKVKASTPQGWAVDGAFEQSIRDLGAAEDEIVRASETIRKGVHFSKSIDDFLSDNQEKSLVIQLSKLAIAHCMLQQEANARWLCELSAESIDARANAFDHLSPTWLDILFQRLKLGHSSTTAEAVFSGVSFIVFNYDRCIEFYLYKAVRDALDVPPERAKGIIESVPIEHVYGSLGPLPWEGSTKGVPFADLNAPLPAVAKGIRTYSEEVSDTSRTIVRVRLEEAEQVVFLGYAFHEQSMKILFPLGWDEPSKVYWTYYGLHDAIHDRARSFLTGSKQNPNHNKCGPAVEQWLFSLMA